MRKSRAQKTATLVALTTLFGVGFVPLFGGPGYEAALAAGLILPALAACATAFDVSRDAAEPLFAFGRGVASGVWLAGVGLAVTFLHGVRVGFCDAAEGVEYFLLGPGAGAVLGGVWGAAVGLLVAHRVRRRKALALVALALAGPVAGILSSLVRFYTSPMVFAFDPFFGFFAGTLYDSIITGLGRLVTYRFGTLATLVSAGAFAASFTSEPAPAGETPESSTAVRSPPRLRFRGPVSLTLAAAASALLSVLHVARGPELGHFETAASIRKALGHSLVWGRCELVYAAGTPLVEARALARECDGHLRELSAYFGVPAPDRVVAFVFANSGQKGELMGAATTYIAKPWRREIYIQRSGFPHPVMRHELAHVVAGAFGSGPFRVAGPLDGWIPDPGRIEGVAVAAAPHDEDLSLAEWARAMRDLGILPPLERVFKLSFFAESSSKAYVAAGAFVDFLVKTHGMDVVRRWYGGASLEAAAGASFADLADAFLRSLDAVTVGPDVLQVARARFDQPAIFGRKCPHVVDRLADEANGALGALDTALARKLYGQVLALDPHDVGGRLGLAGCALRDGKIDEARTLYARVSGDSTLGKAVESRAAEAIADIDLAVGDGKRAREGYDAVQALVVDPDRLRALDVKRYAADGHGERAIVLHLIGSLRMGRDPTAAAAALGAWSVEEPSQGLADYLLARTYLGAGRWDLVSEALDSALARDLPIASVVREAHRDRLIAACALGDADRVRKEYAAWLSLPGSRAPERLEMSALSDRCAPAPPGSPTSILPSPSSPIPIPTSSGPSSPIPSSPSSSSRTPISTSSSSSSPSPCPSSMVRIPPGDVWVGSPRGQGDEDEWPRYRTRLAAFCLDRTEVTVGAYAECVASGACTEADHDRVTCTASGHREDLPINCVDWKQANAFCSHESARLPTEAEWEYAASGGDARRYSWGDESPDGRACWKTSRACPVGRLPAGAFGLADMTGNVWEWTSDGYGDYPWPPVDEPSKVYRGGSWSRRFEKWMSVRLRDRAPASLRGAHLGFRCAATLLNEPCPFGRDAAGLCVHGVLDAECRPGRHWNGIRCASDDEPGPGCGAGKAEVPGHGCVRSNAVDEPKPDAIDPASVAKTRSPEFDADCGRFQAARPHAYRFEGGSHDARNLVERGGGCKNRDVGVGWNSACCP